MQEVLQISAWGHREVYKSHFMGRVLSLWWSQSFPKSPIPMSNNQGSRRDTRGRYLRQLYPPEAEPERTVLCRGHPSPYPHTPTPCQQAGDPWCMADLQDAWGRRAPSPWLEGAETLGTGARHPAHAPVDVAAPRAIRPPPLKCGAQLCSSSASFSIPESLQPTRLWLKGFLAQQPPWL